MEWLAKLFEKYSEMGVYLAAGHSNPKSAYRDGGAVGLSMHTERGGSSPRIRNSSHTTGSLRGRILNRNL